MRFLAPENFDTPNNKQGHETEHERRIEEEKCLESFFSFIGDFWDWRIVKVRIAQERFTQSRQEIGRWWVESLYIGFAFLPLRFKSNLNYFRNIASRKKKRVFPSSDDELSIINFFSYFRGFSIPFSFPIDFKTCRHSSDFFSLRVVRVMEVMRP